MNSRGQMPVPKLLPARIAARSRINTHRGRVQANSLSETGSESRSAAQTPSRREPRAPDSFAV